MVLEDNPWGVIVFFLVVAAGGVGAYVHATTFTDYLGLVATAGGLLGIGHSIHRGAKRMGRRD
jgi:hypothetical protein